MSEKNKTVVDGSVAQAMEAKIERLSKQLEIAKSTLQTISSHYGQRPDDRELARVYEDLAWEALAQIDKLKE